MAVLPGDAHEWPAWLAESSQRVASACSDDALDAPVFNPAGDGRPGTAADREATNISVEATATSPSTGSTTPPTSAADRYRGADHHDEGTSWRAGSG
jgi:hypothetical protein